jgi:putative FmdB family regulatory protein
MPLYEYECTKCNHHTEIVQKITDKPITKCKICNGKMKKLISQSTFHLKGSGWYVTDYASKSGGYNGKTGSKENSTSFGEKDSSKEVKVEAKGADDKPKKDTPSKAKKKAD